MDTFHVSVLLTGPWAFMAQQNTACLEIKQRKGVRQGGKYKMVQHSARKGETHSLKMTKPSIHRDRWQKRDNCEQHQQTTDTGFD